MILIFLFLCRILLAPEFRTLYIESAKRIDPYKKITDAIGWVESRHNTLAINPKEMAIGYFQIREVRLKDYYRRTGIYYTLSDMLDYDKAARVFRYYAELEGWRNPERIARCWNGGVENGMRYKQTLGYWKLVKEQL